MSRNLHLYNMFASIWFNVHFHYFILLRNAKERPMSLLALILYETFEWEMWKVKFIRISKSPKLAKRVKFQRRLLNYKLTIQILAIMAKIPMKHSCNFLGHLKILWYTFIIGISHGISLITFTRYDWCHFIYLHYMPGKLGCGWNWTWTLKECKQMVSLTMTK